MTNITDILTPEAELLASQEAAIAQYQWMERARTGSDIGRDRAAREWFEKHFAEWAQAERQAIDQLLAEPHSPRGRNVTPKPPRRTGSARRVVRL